MTYLPPAAPVRKLPLPAPSSCPQPTTSSLLLRLSTPTDLHVWAPVGGNSPGAAWGQVRAAARGQVGAARGQVKGRICPRSKPAMTWGFLFQGAEGAANSRKSSYRDFNGNGHSAAFRSVFGRPVCTAESLRTRLPLLPPERRS